MQTLKTWLDAERGRATALASHLKVTLSRISQMADNGVPPKYMLAIRDFSNGHVTLEALVQARTAVPAEPAKAECLEPEVAEKAINVGEGAHPIESAVVQAPERCRLHQTVPPAHDHQSRAAINRKVKEAAHA